MKKIEQNVFNDLKIRKLNLRDEKDILRMRNDPITRKMSFNQEIISKKDHNSWFMKKIIDKNSVVYVAEKENNIIGIIQFNKRENNDIFEVNINLNPKFRGNSYSSFLLKKAIYNFEKKFTCTLIAFIKKENIPSLKCFEASGFGIYEENNNIITMQNKNILINKIEQVRSKNNVNWMDIMRLAFKTSPKEAQKIFKNINSEDNEISNLLKKLID